ncbi:MAG: DUF3579 domain-containing protein [Methylophilus sp.]|nr:DUF3579 domain-containing protein [Methylophilus sp.]
MATQEIIIHGLTLAGKPFRPSDWVDRMCSTYATFGEDKKLRYSPYLKPKVVDSVRCLAVDMRLKEVNPEGFEQLIQFANENELGILDESGQKITITA